MTGQHGTPIERFARYVSPEPNSGCWLWVGGLFPTGYGIFGLDKVRRAERAHRFAWEMANGAIPKGLDVCHDCDVRACVNPAHLYLGTRKRNMQDAIDRGRTSRGVGRPLAKLSDADVRAIRASASPSHELAKIYPVSSGRIRAIKRRKGWRHI
jgi:hypothetical protein